MKAMKAMEIMSSNVRTATPLMTVGEAAGIMRDFDVGFLPVVDEKDRSRLVGVVTDRDLVTRALAVGRGLDTSIRFVMTVPPITIAGEAMDVHDVLKLMERHQVRRVPVVTIDGQVLGVISQGDLALRIGPFEPTAVEELLERVSTPSWLHPFMENGPLRPPRLGTSR